jgi:hypothetical protein
MVFVGRMLRRTFTPKRDVILGSWIKLHNKDLNNFHSLSHITGMVSSRTIRWVRHDSGMDTQVWCEKPHAKRPLGKPRCIWDNTIKMVLK